MRGKIIDLNNYKTDILADAIEESRLYFEDTRDRKGWMNKSKEFSHEKCNQWEDIIYNYCVSRKNICGVPLSYFIRKDILSPKDSENREVQIVYQASLVRDIFTRDSRKVLDMSQRLRQLNCRFYTNPLFVKDKLIVGNTCAEIFTNGVFFK